MSTMSSPADDLEAVSKEIPRGDDYLSNHHDLFVADNIAINPLGQLVAWTKDNDLMVGMVIPIFKCDAGDPTWASATWFAAYQIIGVNPLVLEKVFKSRRAKNLHPAITLASATLGGLGGLFGSNTAAISQWSPDMHGKLSAFFPLVPAGLPPKRTGGGLPFATATTGGSSSSSGGGDPPSEILMVTGTERDKALNIMGLARIFDGNKEKLQEFLGVTLKMQAKYWRAMADQRLHRVGRDWAIYLEGNMEKSFEFTFGLPEPVFSDKGVASHCHIGLFQPWGRANTMRVFTSCDQLATAVDTMAEYYNRTLNVTMFTTFVQKLRADLQSNADASLKTIPIDFVVEAVSGAFLKWALFVTGTAAKGLTQEAFIEQACDKLNLSPEQVASDCIRAKLNDHDLTQYKQRGSSNPVVPTVPKATNKQGGKEGWESSTKDNKRLRVQEKAKKPGAGSTGGVTAGGGGASTRGLCYLYTAHYFKVEDSKPCKWPVCRNTHPDWKAGAVPKAEIKAQLIDMSNVSFRDKIYAAIDAFP